MDLIGLKFSFGFFLGSLVGFSWSAPLPGTIGGNAGKVAFKNIYARYLNASLCAFTSLTSGLDGAVLYSE